MHTTRRLLLTGLGYAGLAATLRARACWAAVGAPDDAIATLRGLLDDRAQARVLGAGYRALCPAESEPGVLARLILQRVAPAERSDGAPSRDWLLPALDRCVRAEFGAGDTVRVGGWILARSEARLCALCD
jgi:hypothetical protein